MALTDAELAALCKADPLAFGITHVDLLDGKQWQVASRKWMIEPYKAVNPYQIEKSPIGQARIMALTKSTQAGISTMAITKALHFMTHWPVRVGYMLPRSKDLNDFASTRFDPIVANSEFLRSRKNPYPDNNSTKAFGQSYLFFMEGTVEPRSMPMDALYLDEVDLCNPDHVGTAINRLDASAWKLVTYLSTPTLPNFGIDAIYESSDQREWMVPCPHCGNRQVMDWDKHLRLRGPASEPEAVWYACEKCDKEITVADMQLGAWIAMFPSRSNDIIGYHISQIYTTDAWMLYKHFRDPNQTIAEFYRKRLGRPYTMVGGSIEREDFLMHCFSEPYEPESQNDGMSTYYMGVNQGNQLQLVIAKIPPEKRFPKVVHIELVPFEEGFERVAKLMNIFKIKRAVIDGNPNMHSVKKLMEQFPGRVLMAIYNEQRERFVVKFNEKRVPLSVTIDRTQGFDDLVAAIRKGWLALPGTPPRLSPMVEVFIDQMTSIKRDLEKRKTPSGEIEVAVWRKLRADHLAHASVYLKIAIDTAAGRKFRVAVAK